jgi:hypothetical protein
MIKNLSIRALALMSLCIGFLAEIHAADTKTSGKTSQATKTLSLSGGYSRHLANGGGDFFGAQLSLDLTGRWRIFAALQQSLSGNETARVLEPHETFVQRAERFLRIESGVISPLLSKQKVNLLARGGVAWWHTQLHTTIEDTPMGNFYNFAPMNLNAFAGHAGLEMRAALTPQLGLQATAVYHLVPSQKYSATYDMMGMIATENFVLRLSGLSFGIGLQVELR